MMMVSMAVYIALYGVSENKVHAGTVSCETPLGIGHCFVKSVEFSTKPPPTCSCYSDL